MKAKMGKKNPNTGASGCLHAQGGEVEIPLPAVGLVHATCLQGQESAKLLGIIEQMGYLHFTRVWEEWRSLGMSPREEWAVSGWPSSTGFCFLSSLGTTRCIGGGRGC